MHKTFEAGIWFSRVAGAKLSLLVGFTNTSYVSLLIGLFYIRVCIRRSKQVYSYHA